MLLVEFLSNFIRNNALLSVSLEGCKDQLIAQMEKYGEKLFIMNLFTYILGEFEDLGSHVLILDVENLGSHP